MLTEFPKLTLSQRGEADQRCRLLARRGRTAFFGFEPGKAILKVAENHIARNNTASGEVSVALGKRLKPLGGSYGRGRSSSINRMIGSPSSAFQP